MKPASLLFETAQPAMTLRRVLGALAMLSLLLAANPARSDCVAGLDRTTPDADLVDNGNGTVTHTKTGLMWKQCMEGLSGAGCATGTVATLTWAQALAAPSTANFNNVGGHNDWRLPNIKELKSIVEFACAPFINLVRFPNTPQNPDTWSATTYAPQPDSAWSQSFGAGGNGSYPKVTAIGVRLVRGGPPFGQFDANAGCSLDVDGNGAQEALTDGLIILRAMLGMTGAAVTSGTIGGGNPTRTTWATIQPYLNGNCGTNFAP
jgi:hypothetical protein